MKQPTWAGVADNEYMSHPPVATPKPTVAAALMLTGGGARAAYQVGVLQTLSELRQLCGAQQQGNPFPIIAGTSAGAINAAALACGCDDFDAVVRRVAEVWHNFHVQQVYQVAPLRLPRAGSGWLRWLALGWQMARWRRLNPRSLLDNGPLADLLTLMVPLARLPGLIRDGHLQALAVSASSYSSGEHVTFFEGDRRLMPWTRSQRCGVRDKITHQHLLASSAIPFVFPATALQMDGQTSYFGDGSMRQSAPIAPAIHLGAQRICVIGAGRLHGPRAATLQPGPANYPSPAQIAGHALANIFLDALSVDVERIRRINQTLSLVPPDLRNASNLRPVELLLITPSQRLDSIAADHLKELPPAVRAALGGAGVWPRDTDSQGAADSKGAALASYVLFESGYTRALMALGRADAWSKRAEICRFFGWVDPQATAGDAQYPLQPVIERRRDPLRLR